MTTRTAHQPQAIQHLIAAVTELSFALRELEASRTALVEHAPLAQDGEEYADEIASLVALILKRIRGDHDE